MYCFLEQKKKNASGWIAYTSTFSANLLTYSMLYRTWVQAANATER